LFSNFQSIANAVE